MPRLRKQSHLKQNKDEEESNLSRASLGAGNRLEESNSLLNEDPLVARKMKYKDKAKLIKEFEKRTVKRQQSASQEVVLKDEDRLPKIQLGSYLDKFTDDDKDVSRDSLNVPTQPKKKKQPRASSKFFASNLLLEGEMEEKEFVMQELLIQKKQAKDPDHLLLKVERKAETFKNRLEFKNFDQDIKFKQNMKDKLKSIEGHEEIQLVIQVPKVVAGKHFHVDNALFLKNVKQSNDSSLSEPTQDEEESVPKDRKHFYEGLAKKLKMKRAESITESILKQCFKKSRLDENDFLLDLNEHEPQIKQVASTSHQQDRPQEQETIEQDTSKSASFSERGDEDLGNTHEAEPTQNEISNPIEQNIQVPHQQQKDEEQAQSNDPEPQPIRSNQTKVKQKKPRKSKKFCVKDLIQEQAEDSDDGCIDPRKAEHEAEQSDDDGDLASLIDDDITLCAEEQQFAHRKFIRDMLEEQDKKFLLIQKKMSEQRFMEDEHLRKRMEAAAKRNQTKDKEEQLTLQTEKNKTPSEHSDSSISNSRNLQKIKQLEIELGLVKPISSQSTPLSQNQTINKAFSKIEHLLTLQSGNFRNPIRNGLQNVDRLKQKKKSGKQ